MPNFLLKSLYFSLKTKNFNSKVNSNHKWSIFDQECSIFHQEKGRLCSIKLDSSWPVLFFKLKHYNHS